MTNGVEAFEFIAELVRQHVVAGRERMPSRMTGIV